MQAAHHLETTSLRFPFSLIFNTPALPKTRRTGKNYRFGYPGLESFGYAASFSDSESRKSTTKPWVLGLFSGASSRNRQIVENSSGINRMHPTASSDVRETLPSRAFPLDPR